MQQRLRSAWVGPAGEPRRRRGAHASPDPSAPAVPAAQLWAAVHLAGPDSGEKLQRLALGAQAFTPRVSLEPPDGLLLEVQGSLRLFAGVAGLRAAVTQQCRRLGVAPALAFAPTPLAALTLARAGRALAVTEPAQLTGRLAPLPLATLRWPDEMLGRLARMGVRTIGAALRLPRAGFARRFGVARLAALDRLTGRAPDPRAAFRPRERFRHRCAFACELESHAAILAALAPAFTALGAFLEARQCGIVELECLLAHRHAPPTSCVLRLAAPAADVERLAQLLAEPLSALALPEPVRGCELRGGVPVPYAPDRRSLWQPGEHGGGPASEACGLIERLRARLGPDAIHGLALLEGHRPEQAWGATDPPAAAGRGAAATDRASTRGAAHRPLWLLPVPLSLPVRDGRPRRRGAGLRLGGEPERIESGWWDGGEIARDYYTATDLHGVRLWVFRERAAPHGWYLHGVFG
ncbi:MAG TPA: DNA polymerase Y family protein [Steroidobacteraceae bacterium]|nr:DNA polymerase Y family protein [Steroidobacteraceae bacterium]